MADKRKNIAHTVFIDGLSGMALGLFATLIVGTIFVQISDYISGAFGNLLLVVGKTAQLLTGAGIGCGVALKADGPARDHQRGYLRFCGRLREGYPRGDVLH